MILIDTSALFALLNAEEPNHARAAATYRVIGERERLVTHNYVIVETSALVHRRLGPLAARDLLERLVPAMETLWVDRALHATAVTAFVAARRRGLSLVDRVSFQLMRERGIETAFAFDRDFAEEGFSVVP